VIEALTRLISERGAPRFPGSEFVSKASPERLEMGDRRF